MRQNGDGRSLDVCYNVQTVVDDKHKLIVDFDVINRAHDKGNLEKMIESAMSIMEAEAITVLADKGYYDGEDIVKCEQNGVTCLVAKSASGGSKHFEGFEIKNFSFESESDCYICPLGEKLRFMRLHKHTNKKEYRVYANYSVCARCKDKNMCTKSKHRTILRLPYQDILDTVDRRTKCNRHLYRKRQEIVEHPFGTTKAVWGFKQFLCRSKPKVTAETALAYLAYNLRRFANIFTQNSHTILGALT